MNNKLNGLEKTWGFLKMNEREKLQELSAQFISSKDRIEYLERELEQERKRWAETSKELLKLDEQKYYQLLNQELPYKDPDWSKFDKQYIQLNKNYICKFSNLQYNNNALLVFVAGWSLVTSIQFPFYPNKALFLIFFSLCCVKRL